jgi:hypothetical protein
MLFRRRVPGTSPRFELVTRQGCHLCEEMAALLDQTLPAHGLSWSPLDVDADADPALRERYTDSVPVLLRDGHPVAKLRTDRRTLERLIRGRR